MIETAYLFSLERTGGHPQLHSTLKSQHVPMQLSWLHQPVFESRAPRGVTDLAYQAPVGMSLDDPSTIVDLAKKRQDDEERWSVQDWASYTADWSADSKEFARRTLALSPERRREFIEFLQETRDDRNMDRETRDYYGFLVNMATLSDKALGKVVQSFSVGETSTYAESSETEETDFGIWHDADAERRARLDKYFPDES
jgi:hypothetical protein